MFKAIYIDNVSNWHMLKKITQSCFIWGIGWYFFGAMEALIKVIAKTPLHFSAVLLTLTSYALFGALAGSLFAVARSLKVRSWRAEHTSLFTDYSTYIGFLLSIVLVTGLTVINKKMPALNNQTVLYTLNLIFLIACAAVYALLRRVFSQADHTAHTILFLSLCVSLYAGLLLGLFINGTLLPERLAGLSSERILVNCAVVAGSIIIFVIVYVLLRLLIKVPALMHVSAQRMVSIFIIGAVVGSLVYIGRQTQRDNFINQLTTILKQRPNIFIISLDTTCRDHLSCYGYSRKTTPHIDRLVPESLVFSRAYSASSWTLPSHASLFTGCYPSMHGADRADNTPAPYFCRKLSNANVTIAEILSDYGYRTFGVIAGALCSSAFGMGQGFAYFNENLSEHGDRRAAAVSDAVLEWLHNNARHKKQEKFMLFNVALPVFGFIHYFDAHHPYRPPAPYDNLYPGRDDSIILHYGDSREATYPGQEWKLLTDIIKRTHVMTGAEKSHLLSQYDGEIAYVDSQADRVLNALRELQIFDSSMIIIFADHGEFFGEHNLALHGMALYEEMLHVPLIIKYPAWMKKTGTVNTPVSLVDVMPDMLKTVSIQKPKNVQGVAFDELNRKIIAENVQDPTWKNRPDHAYLARDLKVLYRGNYKYIWASDGRSELYDIIADPLEQNNLITKNSELVQNMEKELGQWKHTFQPVHGDNDAVKTDKAVIDQLRGLGYIE
jgi:arylsulfatase A-like enzyme